MSDKPEDKSSKMKSDGHEADDSAQTKEISNLPEAAAEGMDPGRTTKAEGVASVPTRKRRLKVTKGPKRPPKADPQSSDNDKIGTTTAAAAAPVAADSQATELESADPDSAPPEASDPEGPRPQSREPEIAATAKITDPERGKEKDGADEVKAAPEAGSKPLEEASDENPPRAPEEADGSAKPEENEVREAAGEEPTELLRDGPEPAEQSEASEPDPPDEPSPAVAAPPDLSEGPKATDEASDRATEDQDRQHKVPRPRRTAPEATPIADQEAPTRARPSPRLFVLILLLVMIVAVWWLWPTSTPTEVAAPDGSELSQEEVQEIEQLLGDLAIDPGPIDGVVDEQTQEAIRFYQESGGLPVDGEPTAALLNDLREVAAGL